MFKGVAHLTKRLERFARVPPVEIYLRSRSVRYDLSRGYKHDERSAWLMNNISFTDFLPVSCGVSVTFAERGRERGEEETQFWILLIISRAPAF